jgi:hypothetical protein
MAMGVTFEEQDLTVKRPQVKEKSTFIGGLLMKTGLIKTQRQANVAMIGISILCIALTFFVVFS